MKKFILLSILFILSTQLFTGCSCEHEWVDATCNSSRICSLCGTKDGEPLGHSWTDATCTTPKTCALCAATQGDSLPHTPGETAISTDYVLAVAVETQSCTGCGTVLNTNETTISLVDGDYFLLSPEEFVTRLNHVYASNGNTTWSASLELLEGDEQDFNMVSLRHDDIIYARVFFGSKSKEITVQEKDERIISLLDISISFGEIVTQQNEWTIEEYHKADTKDLSNQMSELLVNEDLFADILKPIIQACNSNMSEADADAFARNAHISTRNPFGMEDIRYQTQCGDCYVGVYNLYLANLSYRIRIGTTSDFWIGQSETVS